MNIKFLFSFISFFCVILARPGPKYRAFELILVNDEVPQHNGQFVSAFADNTVGRNPINGSIAGYALPENKFRIGAAGNFLSYEETTYKLAIRNVSTPFSVNDNDFLTFQGSDIFPSTFLGENQLVLYLPRTNFPATAAIIPFKLKVDWWGPPKGANRPEQPVKVSF